MMSWMKRFLSVLGGVFSLSLMKRFLSHDILDEVFYHMMSLIKCFLSHDVLDEVFYPMMSLTKCFLSLTKCFLPQDILDEVFFTTWCPWWSVFYHMMSLMRFSITWCPWWSIFYLSLMKCFLSHDVLDEVISIMSLVKHLLSACLTSQETMLEFWLLMQTLDKQRCRKRAFLVGSIPLKILFLWRSCVSAAQKGLTTNRDTSPLRKNKTMLTTFSGGGCSSSGGSGGGCM